MTKTITLAAIVAIFLCGQALGAQTITFTAELGGDNLVGDGTTPYNPFTGDFPPFNSGSDADGQTFDPDTGDITWDMVVELSGAGATNGWLNGIANVVFSLEVHEGSTAGGALVTTVVWDSSVNDGSDASTRPEEMAAFTSAFDLAANGANGGRVWDVCGSGGPYMDRYQYPTTSDWGGGHGLPYVAGSAQTLSLDGKLVGMGCGYSKYDPTGVLASYYDSSYTSYNCSYAGGNMTAGVGLPWVDTPWAANGLPVYDIWPGLGVYGTSPAYEAGPIAEGQMDASALLDGEYCLVVIAGNCNVLMDSFDPEGSNPGAFAVAADTVVEDTISFFLKRAVGPCPAPVLQTADSVKTHNAVYTGKIALVTAPASANVEPRMFIAGDTKIEIVFDGPVTALDGTIDAGGEVVVTNGTINTITGDGTATLTIDLSAVVDDACMKVALTDIVTAVPTGCVVVDPDSVLDVDLYIRNMSGNSDLNNIVDVFDMSVQRFQIPNPVGAANFVMDVDDNGVIDVFDMSVTRFQIAGSVGVSCP